MDATPLRLRPARKSDARLLWEWRNDPLARAVSLHREPIPWQAHCDWFDRTLTCEDSRIWILEEGGHPVGQIRYDRKNGDAEISVVIANSFRGHGLGTRLLEMSAPHACRELEVARVIGIVKRENASSMRIFERAGFSLVESEGQHGDDCVRFERPCAAVDQTPPNAPASK